MAAIPAAGETPIKAPQKEPWTFTSEERIALRVDPERAKERIRESGRVRAAGAPVSKTETSWVDKFEGKNHPELFLPYEVFDQLIGLAFSGTPRDCQIAREGFMPEVKRRGLPADFWQRLQSITTIYVADLRTERDLLSAVRQQTGTRLQRAEQALELKHGDVCRSRADALAAARHEFGPQLFDRFMYQVMAVNMFFAADRMLDPEVLRNAERGCR
jgi:hypothetical protein